ncbi:unnamed protein product [Mesocestoides corti]|uniref:Uncharacterized protein n=1 Tax=Mesocestoides corti TaxID=53468 RepID=A0A0R3ULR3_MESCO|nr:unnamed protein product [Mesocestoides corti]
MSKEEGKARDKVDLERKIGLVDLPPNESFEASKRRHLGPFNHRSKLVPLNVVEADVCGAQWPSNHASAPNSVPAAPRPVLRLDHPHDGLSQFTAKHCVNLPLLHQRQCLKIFPS